MSNVARDQFLENHSFYDHETDAAQDLGDARLYAREQLVQALLADEPIFLEGQRWTLEELIEERIEFTDDELDHELARIDYQNFDEPENHGETL
tara:strand:- start:703 stop:984 length:282 start_codon:yes stop_codon:yes gene_type:complete